MASDGFPPTSAEGGYSGSEFEDTLVVAPARRGRRGRRLLWLLIIVPLLIVLLGGVASAAVYEDPALLAPIGNVLLGAQPGTVAWNGSDPINILVMGVDQRTNEQTRSDSMIVLHIDPSSHDVTMLSVPRDLWITIPAPNDTYGQYKINAAYALGQPYAKGPQYAELAVEGALHIPINYYAVLKFDGFKRVIDAMGGVTVCVPHELNDPLYPADVGYGYHPIDIKAGCQKMDGTTALEYARERHANAQQDLGRIQQQQAVLDGVAKSMASPAALLHLAALLSAVNDALDTSLPHGVLPQLGLLLGRARGSHTEHMYLNQDGGYVTSGVSADGQDVLQGNWPRISALVARLFSDPQLRAEDATVQVRSGQQTPGLAVLYTSVLQGMGFNTNGFAPRNADHAYTRTLLVVNADYPGSDYTARKLAQMFQADVSYRHIGLDHAHIVVILGSQAAEGS